MLNSQPLAMMRSRGTGELDVVEKAELLLAGDKIAAVGNHLREDRDQILAAIGLISGKGRKRSKCWGSSYLVIR